MFTSQLMTSNTLATYLGIAPQTIRRWRLEGRGPKYLRLGDSLKARVAYRPSDVDEWLENRDFHSTSEESIKSEKK